MLDGCQITCPVNVVEPAHLGQMFYDSAAHIFYQARGLTAVDWQLVTPDEFIGSFVKVYDYFVGVPENDPKGDHVEQWLADSRAVAATMALDGMTILQSAYWRAAGGFDVLQVRLRFDRSKGLMAFVGFAPKPRPHTMPDGVGFFCPSGAYVGRGHCEPIVAGEMILLRVERYPHKSTFLFIDGERVANAGLQMSALEDAPCIALFSRAPGARRIAAGYPQALKRSLER